jgi:putative tryptophan/tyrosine transport system substrate-binding protein
VKRREFTALLAGAAAWPLAARAQQPAVPVIGFLNGASPQPFAHLVRAFHQGLEQMGYVEGRNVATEFRWAEGQPARLPDLAAELVRREVALIVASGGTPVLQAAKAATIAIPIVTVGGADPVRLGLVASLNRPAGNITGVYMFTTALEPKRLGLLRQLVPTATTIGVLVNPNTTIADAQVTDLQEAARSLGLRLHVLYAGNEHEISAAFGAQAEARMQALLVCADPFFNSRRDLLVTLAARHSIPAIYEQREFAVAGGLMSYGTSLSDAYRQGGLYAGRILQGEKPADLPVVQSTRFELVINLKTAATLGLEIPQGLVIAADEVIE